MAPTVERRTFRTPFRNVVFGAFYGVMALLGAAGIAEFSDGNADAGELIFAIVLASGGSWFSFRGFRAAIALSDSGLVKRGLLISRSLPWSEIVDVEITIDHGILDWRVPKLSLSSGKSVRLYEVGQLRDGPGRVAELVAEVQRHLVVVGHGAAAGEACDEKAQDLPGRGGVHE